MCEMSQGDGVNNVMQAGAITLTGNKTFTCQIFKDIEGVKHLTHAHIVHIHTLHTY